MSRHPTEVVHPGCEVINRRPGKQLTRFGKAWLWNESVTDQPHGRALFAYYPETNQVIEHRTVMEVSRYTASERLERWLGACKRNQVGPIKTQPARGNLIRCTRLTPTRPLRRIVSGDLLGGLTQRADILSMETRQQTERRIGAFSPQPDKLLFGLRKKHRLERGCKTCVPHA